jgi:uncharacterized protein (DUF433 family)
MGLKDLEPQLLALSPAEKAEALKLLTLDLTHHAWPGVEKTPGVVGGAACVVRTSILVWAVENYRRLGWSEARVLENYPVLRAADLVNTYADAHSDEIEEEIRANEGLDSWRASVRTRIFRGRL